MSYGIQIINDAGADIVAGSQNVFAVGSVLNPWASGSQAFPLGAGETLVAIPEVIHGAGQGRYMTGVSVGGNIVYWNVDPNVPTDGVFRLVIYKTGVV